MNERMNGMKRKLLSYCENPNTKIHRLGKMYSINIGTFLQKNFEDLVR